MLDSCRQDQQLEVEMEVVLIVERVYMYFVAQQCHHLHVVMHWL